MTFYCVEYYPYSQSKQRQLYGRRLPLEDAKRVLAEILRKLDAREGGMGIAYADENYCKQTNCVVFAQSKRKGSEWYARIVQDGPTSFREYVKEHHA